jgi:excisionase family DNA binding protein
MLSVSLSKIYQLLRDGELMSYSDGKSRRIVVASIHRYIKRRRAASGGEWRTWQHSPRSRRREQPAKVNV